MVMATKKVKRDNGIKSDWWEARVKLVEHIGKGAPRRGWHLS